MACRRISLRCRYNPLTYGDLISNVRVNQIRAILVVVLFVILSGCGDIYRYIRSGEVGLAIKKEIRDKHEKEIKIDRVTQFPWNELFIFGGYTRVEEICKSLSIPKGECGDVITSSPIDDAQQLMVFRLNGRVVHSEIHIAWNGRFEIGKMPLDPSSAVFNVVVNGRLYNGQESLLLKLKNNNEP
jgi:hypothetical protein